jgi:hypothetical protein
VSGLTVWKSGKKKFLSSEGNGHGLSKPSQAVAFDTGRKSYAGGPTKHLANARLSKLPLPAMPA